MAIFFEKFVCLKCIFKFAASNGEQNTPAQVIKFHFKYIGAKHYIFSIPRLPNKCIDLIKSQNLVIQKVEK